MAVIGSAVEPALVDLVCGPASPLPETYQRYRLVARLGAGGQADVYRGVRLCGGVTSAPITVKVFRIDPRRPLADELRSWDKGDAALMDLNNRGVPGICRRADGFYGPPPRPTGTPANIRDAVPYQIYDYLHGINLREYVTSRAGLTGTRLSAPTALHSLAETIRALHFPSEPGACPVLHMDIKPSNIMTLANGEIRLIDFTGARYWRHEEITQIAYTPESGGPEALRGEVSPSYDVHGFGAVVFFMLTGSAPRGQHAPPMAQHPIFEGRTALRNHLLPALADRPSDRPSTMELPAWVDRLLMLVRTTGVPDLGMDWSEPKAAAVVGLDGHRAVGRAKAVLNGTETEAFLRIELLERELVALRANVPTSPEAELGLLPPLVPQLVSPTVAPTSGGPANVPTSGGPAPTSGGPAPTSGGPAPTSGGPAMGSAPVSGLPSSGGPAGGGLNNGAANNQAANNQAANNVAPSSGGPSGAGAAPVAMRVGRAAVVPRPPADPSTGYAMPPNQMRSGAVAGARVAGSVPDRIRRLKRGGGWSVAGAVFAFICWVVWAADNRSQGIYVAPAVFVGTLLVAAGLFIVLRLLGRLVIENWMHRQRRGAVGAHVAVGVFLFAVGVTYLQQTTWIVKAFGFMKGLG